MKGFTLNSFFVTSTVLLSLLWGGCSTQMAAQEATSPDPMSIEDFAFLTGSWDGALEYLNYGDDKTRVSLPTRAVYSHQEDHIAYRFIYTEPNGEEVQGEGSIRVAGGNRVMFNGASHKLVSRTLDHATNVFEVRITRMGQDNDRDAQIDHLIQSKDGTLSITRYVLLDGAEESFVRHAYTFKRTE